MTTVVGVVRGPSGKLKNCDDWAEYEGPGRSTFANLCNGGSYEGEVWQVCPSRLECRAATYRQNNPGIQVLASQGSGGGFAGRRSLPVKHDAPRLDPVRVVVPTAEEYHLRTSRLEQQHQYRPSPTFLPDEGENLFIRMLKNFVQAAIHAVFHQGMTMTEGVDLFPNRMSPEQQEEPQE